MIKWQTLLDSNVKEMRLRNVIQKLFLFKDLRQLKKHTVYEKNIYFNPYV